MFGANNKTLYWVKITPDEFKNENDSISKGVQIGRLNFDIVNPFACKSPFKPMTSLGLFSAEQKNDTVKFKDDFLDYTLTVSTGELRMSLYATEYAILFWIVVNFSFYYNFMNHWIYCHIF